MDKRQDLFTIGEIAKALGVTRRIILNYEDRGLIRPDVKDGPTGNRYYTIDTFTQIRTIRVFQKLGLSLDEIRAYLDGSMGLEPLIHRLEALRDELNLNIEKLRERSTATPPQIHELWIEGQKIYRVRAHAPTVEERKDLLRTAALEAMRAYGTDTTRRMYFIEYPLAAPDEVSFCVSVPPESEGPGVEYVPPFRALSLYHHGSYRTLGETGRALLECAQEHELAVRGVVRHVYLEGPPQHKDEKKFITQVLLPLA